MKTKPIPITRNQPDVYYKILKECVDNPMTNTAQISIKLDISESDSGFRQLEVLNFITINRTGGNMIELSPQGFSTYLSISSQKQSSEQAIKAIKFASWAIGISIASFIASIVFNILSLAK